MYLRVFWSLLDLMRRGLGAEILAISGDCLMRICRFSKTVEVKGFWWPGHQIWITMAIF